MKNLFTEHPASVDETYFEHMGMATKFGFKMMWAGFACFIHGFLPFLFTTTGKDTICKLHNDMVTHRNRKKSESADNLQHS